MDDLTVQLLRGVEMLVVLAIDGDTVGLEVRPQSIARSAVMVSSTRPRDRQNDHPWSSV
jgi:hypothetical protein